jgi:putative ABC transport system permease protein
VFQKDGRVVPTGNRLIDLDGEKTSDESESLTVDNAFIRMFSFPFLAGDKNTALNNSHEVVLTETFARTLFKYQGSDLSALLNKTLVLENEKQPYQVKGILKDVPPYSHLQFNLLISYPTLISNGYREAEYDFTYSDFWHYVKLKPDTDYKTLQLRFGNFSDRHFQGNKVSGSDEKFFLQPLTEAHLYSDFEYEIGITGKANVVWGLLILAIFILVIAWINYINLSTARAMERAKEVGLRKVSGARKTQLIFQFLSESLVINLMALMLAIIFIQMAQPYFNSLLGKDLSFTLLLGDGYGGYGTTVMLAAILLTGIVLSGFYPAFVLSSFQPTVVLKGSFGSSQKGVVLRKVLVVGQFAATGFLIAGSMVVYQQIAFMNAKDLGVNIKQVLVISPPILTTMDTTFKSRMNSFKHELKNIPNVTDAATSQRVPSFEMPRSFNVRRAGTTDNLTTRRMGVDNDFFDLYGVTILAGRAFAPEDYTMPFSQRDRTVLNQYAANLLGFQSPDDAIGKQIMVFNRIWNVIGVVADYHQKSLRHPLEPIVFLPTYDIYDPVSIKVQTANMDETISLIKEKYNAFFPGNYFDYYFLNERFNQQYRDDQLFGKVFGLFAGLAIFVACLGLFGLSAFITRLQTKEIGIRKVLGATAVQIVTLLSNSFAKPVIASIIIAMPIAWWVMNTWLQQFTYRIEVSAWILALSGLITICIALFTVSFQTVKAAMTNPTKSLRSE